MEKEFKSFTEFYPYYLNQHSNPTCRLFHFIGTSIAISLFILAITQSHWVLILIGILQGYAFAWIGHFGFEKNRPATFKYPFYSFMGDFRMFWDIFTGKIACFRI
jgi:hypothetical protein